MLLQTPQILDAAPRGGANIEVMCALATGKKGTVWPPQPRSLALSSTHLCHFHAHCWQVSFFKGDEAGTPIGAHKVFDFNGENQDVGMVRRFHTVLYLLSSAENHKGCWKEAGDGRW